MSEETKEILDKLKDSNWYDELDLTGTRWIELTWKETHLLLDYITNLQQKVEQLEKENKELNKMCELYSQSLYNADLTKAEDEIDRLNNIINELEKTIENRLMAVPDDVLDDGIEEIKRTTKIAVYQVILGDLHKLKELKENNKDAC